MLQTILHIGLEKTGTTSIQHLLVENRDKLKAASVLVPKSINSGNNYHLAIASYSTFRADGLTKQLKIYGAAELAEFRGRKVKALRAECAESSPQKTIISSEHFQSRLTSIQDLKLLRELLEQAGLSNFKVVLYLRDPLKITMSHHGMAIKKGIHVTEDFYSPSHPRISQILSFEKSIQNWKDVFFDIEVRLYPEGQAPEVLLRDFIDATGIALNDIDLDKQEKRNVNLSSDALTVLNQINKESSHVRRLADDRWLFNRLEKEFPGGGLKPSKEQIVNYEKHFEAENERIRAEWFPAMERLFASNWKPQEQYPPEHLLKVRAKIEKLIGLGLLRHRLVRMASLPYRLIRKSA